MLFIHVHRYTVLRIADNDVNKRQNGVTYSGALPKRQVQF
jgi:hypothetical protein